MGGVARQAGVSTETLAAVTGARLLEATAEAGAEDETEAEAGAEAGAQPEAAAEVAAMGRAEADKRSAPKAPIATVAGDGKGAMSGDDRWRLLEAPSSGERERATAGRREAEAFLLAARERARKDVGDAGMLTTSTTVSMSAKVETTTEAEADAEADAANGADAEADTATGAGPGMEPEVEPEEPDMPAEATEAGAAVKMLGLPTANSGSPSGVGATASSAGTRWLGVYAAGLVT